MKQNLIPALAFPPGDILQEELEASSLTSEDLAQISENLPLLVDEIMKGNQLITPEIAMMLHHALGTSPEFWLNLEADYRLYLASQT